MAAAPPPRGWRVLVTRPDEQAEESALELRRLGCEPLLFPCLHRAPPVDGAPLRAALRRLGDYRLVALTSANAVRALGDGLAELGLGLPATTQLAAVGPQTAGAIERCGWTVGLQAVGAGHESSAAGLAAMILQHFAGSGAPSVLFPRAAEARPTLLDILRGAGIPVDDVVAYRMVEASPESLRPAVAQLRAGAVDLVPFGSPRTVAVFLGALRAAGADPAALLGSVRVGAMGATTAAALEAEGVRVDGVGREGRYTALVSELMGDVLPSAAKE